MKRIVLAAIAGLALAGLSLPASAEGGRNGAAAVGAVGGFALGTVLGSAFPAPRHVYVAPAPVYVEPAYAVEEECYVRRERVWVPGWGWELRRRTVCN